MARAKGGGDRGRGGGADGRGGRGVRPEPAAPAGGVDGGREGLNAGYESTVSCSGEPDPAVGRRRRRTPSGLPTTPVRPTLAPLDHDSVRAKLAPSSSLVQDVRFSS